MHHAHSCLLRRGRISEPGRLYLLTTVTHQRTPLFLNLTNARLVIHQMRQSDNEHASRSLAWVVMPDHVHWLMELGSVTLSTLMRRFKSRSSVMLHKAGVSQESVWQPGYQDRALRRDEDVLNVARYIVANPLRAGLAKSIREYPHWDAAWL